MRANSFASAFLMPEDVAARGRRDRRADRATGSLRWRAT